jgi:hypothetical protein
VEKVDHLLYIELLQLVDVILPDQPLPLLPHPSSTAGKRQHCAMYRGLGYVECTQTRFQEDVNMKYRNVGTKINR